MDAPAPSVRDEMEALLSRSGLASDPTLRTFVLAMASACGRVEEIGRAVSEAGAAVAEAKASPPSVLSQDQWALLMKSVRVEIRQALRDAAGDAIMAARLQFFAIGAAVGGLAVLVGLAAGRFWP
jgi:hypothetical protein